MAEMLLGLVGSGSEGERPGGSAVTLSLGPRWTCRIEGREGTYQIVRDGGDVVAALGYVRGAEGRPAREALSEILASFRESRIGEIKKQLIGQYVLLVKKGEGIFVFSDFLGGRNVFYANDGPAVSSSFARLEKSAGVVPDDFEPAKVLEFLAMRHVLYPAWLGRATCHRRIQWLLPYEYLAIDAARGELRLGSIVTALDNTKHADRTRHSNDLVSLLRGIVANPDLKNAAVAATLTGGHDSRLVAAVAHREFPGVRFRLAASAKNPRSLRDLRVARKTARAVKVPLDVFWFDPGRDEEAFKDLTEGLSPAYNHTVAPLIQAAGSYALGLGGVFGTELFMPIPWASIDEFIRVKIGEARKALQAGDEFWASFERSIRGQFLEIRAHYLLAEDNERDLIRMFGLLNTARYGSMILAAFNRAGNQLDPYGHFAVYELALRIPPALWGNHKRLGGNGLIQKEAMGRLNRRMGRVMTYMHSRPMLSLSPATLPKYLIGYARQIGAWAIGRFAGRRPESRVTRLPGAVYVSDGWEIPFLERTARTYPQAGDRTPST